MRTHGTYGGSTSDSSTNDAARQQRAKRRTEDIVDVTIPRDTPVGQVIHHYAHATRFRVSSDLIERRAQHLHSQNSYEDWKSLSDRDQELWRHIARVQSEDS